MRTDFTDHQAWDELCSAVGRPSEPDGFLPTVDIVNDEQYQALTAAQLRDLLLDPFDGQSFFFVADGDAVSSPGHPLLVVPIPYRDPEWAFLNDEPRAEFRVAVAQLWAVENNLSLANMDWADFAGNVDSDGVFRGFDTHRTS